MDNLNLPPFLAGDKIEAIESHRQGVFKKGDKFTALKVDKCICGCGTWTVDIGIREPHFTTSACTVSGKGGLPKHDGFKCSRFRPLQQQKFPLIKLKKVAEQELCAS